MKKIEFEIAMKLIKGEKIGTYRRLDGKEVDLFMFKDYCTYYGEDGVAVLVGKVSRKRNLKIYQDFKNRSVSLLLEDSKWDLSRIHLMEGIDFDESKFSDGYGIGYTRVYGIENLKDFLRTMIDLENFMREKNGLPAITPEEIRGYLRDSKDAIKDHVLEKISVLRRSHKISRVKKSKMSSNDMLIHCYLRKLDCAVCPFQFMISTPEEEKRALYNFDIYIDDEDESIEMTIKDRELCGSATYKCQNGVVSYDMIREIADGEFIRVIHKVTDYVDGDYETGEIFEVIRGLKDMLRVSKDSDLVYNVGEKKVYSYGEWTTASEEEKQAIFEEIKNAVGLTSSMTIDKMQVDKKAFTIQ